MSKDSKANVTNQESLTPAQLKLERVIQRSLAECEVDSVPITDSLRATFKSKLWRMGQCLAKVGGTKRKEILESWKGPQSTWEVHIDLVDTTKSLVKEKRKADRQLASERAKRQKLEEEVKASKKSAKALEVVNRRLKTSLLSAKATHGGHSGRMARRKSWSQLSRQQQSCRRRQIHLDVESSLAFLENDGFVVRSLELENLETKEKQSLDVKSGKFSSSKGIVSQNDHDSDLLRLVLYVKKFALSKDAYHELSMVCELLPRSWKIKDLIQKLNSSWEITPCPEGEGVQQSLRSRLTERVRHLAITEFESPPTLQVKISGDGTQVCQKLHLINITFTLLNEGARAMSASGNHSIAVIHTEEKYETLATALADVRAEMSTLTTVTVGGMTFSVEYFLGADWKFLALVCGLDAANSEHACVWCKCPKEERHNMDKTWSMTNVELGARTIGEVAENAKRPKKKQEFNCSRTPLFRCH